MELIPSDYELVCRLQADDVKAFDMIYARYSLNIYRFAFKYLRSEEEAEELVQAIFLKIWEIRRSLKSDSSFKSFLYTIVYNEICNLFRKRKHNQEYTKELRYINKNSSTEAEDRIDFKSLLTRVEKIVQKLPDKQREIFLKSRSEGKSSKEIAKEVGLKPATIDNYISESLKFIKSKLKKESMYVIFFLLTVSY
ncbi:MAG TPA: RNA polymerase sigma-70 factor [Bacteroidales bacterium]|nr:RNA polymerase sigma-70 factor [Bacteroidales bacterium]